MATERRERGCLRKGCCGCVAVVGVVVLVLAGIAGWGWLQRPGEPEPTERTLAREARGEASREPGGEPSTEPGGEPSTEPGGEPSTEPGGEDARAGEPRGRVELWLEVGTFEVVPAPAGSPLRVEASYDAAMHELKETHSAPEGEPWSWFVHFAPRGGLLGMLFGGSRQEPKLTVHLPRELPMDVKVHATMGQSTVDLGGLSLGTVEMSASMGQHGLDFSEPLAGRLDRLSFEGRMGELSVERLGNAAPATTRVETSFGEVLVDLAGSWPGGGDVEVRHRYGQATVEAPEGVPAVVVNAGVDGGEADVSPDVPTSEEGLEPGTAVRIDASVRGGQLVVRR